MEERRPDRIQMRDWIEVTLQRGSARDRSRGSLRKVGFVIGPERVAGFESCYTELFQTAVDIPKTRQIAKFESAYRLKMGCCFDSNCFCLSKLRRNSKVNIESSFGVFQDRNIKKVKKRL